MFELCNTGDAPAASFSREEIREILRAQRAHFATGATRPLANRREALKRLLSSLEEREDDLIAALSSDLGKPPVEAWLAEIYFLRTELRHIIRHLASWMKPRKASHPLFLLPARSEVRREPFGVTLIVAPWNYPLQLALSPAIGAIAAGNCVVIKPSEATPMTSKLLSEVVSSALPVSQAAVVTGGPETGAALLEERFDHYFFTGGERIGRLVAEAAAREMVPCVLELGGKSPAMIDWCVDLDLAAERIAAAKFFNAGQTCMAPDFVAVPDFHFHEFTSKLEQSMDRFYGSSQPDLACLPNKEQWERLMRIIPADARQIGEDDPDMLRLAPRWSRVDWDHPSMKEEVFGPFLPVIAYPDREEFLNQLASKPSPLALYLFSDNPGFVESAIARIPTGSVCVNDAMKQAVNLDLPFGGVGPSGHGRYRGKTSFEAFSWERPITTRFNIRDPFNPRPPYGNLLERLRKRLR